MTPKSLTVFFFRNATAQRASRNSASSPLLQKSLIGIRHLPNFAMRTRGLVFPITQSQFYGGITVTEKDHISPLTLSPEKIVYAIRQFATQLKPPKTGRHLRYCQWLPGDRNFAEAVWAWRYGKSENAKIGLFFMRFGTTKYSA